MSKMSRRTAQTVKLAVMIGLTFGFFLVEIVVGYMTGSLALISDSYHMLSDFIALIVAVACIRISKMNSKTNTYGWIRAEVLGALVNSVFLIALCFTILTDGIQRMVNPEEIHDPHLLLYVGIAGLAINVVGIIIFAMDAKGGHHGHSHGGLGHSHGGGGHSHGGHGHSHGGHGHSHGEHGHSHSKANGHSNGEAGGHSKTESNGISIVHRSNLDYVAIELNPSSTLTIQEEAAASATASGTASNRSSGTPNAEADEEDHGSDSEDDTLSVAQEVKNMKSGSQLNMIGVLLHVSGDALGSVAVIVTAIVAIFVQAEWVKRLDPLLSIVMVIIILWFTIPVFRESASILLQSVPKSIRVSELRDKLLEKVHGVINLHEFHVWQLAGNRIIASGHIRCNSLRDYKKIALKVKSFFHNEGIHSTTFQPEFNENFQELLQIESSRDCFLECGPDQKCFENTCCSDRTQSKLKTDTFDATVSEHSTTQPAGGVVNNSAAVSNDCFDDEEDVPNDVVVHQHTCANHDDDQGIDAVASSYM